MKLYFLKQKSLDMLEQTIPDNLNKYQDAEMWVDQYFIDNDKPNYFFDTGIEVDDYQLISGGPETDFSNAKILYEALQGHINLVQASDLRLWAYMAHKQHWDYMHTRWGIDLAHFLHLVIVVGNCDRMCITPLFNRHIFRMSLTILNHACSLTESAIPCN